MLNKGEVKVLVAQLCPTLCDSLDCSQPGSSVQVILQASRLEWVAMPSPEDLLNAGIELICLMFPALVGGFLPLVPSGKPNI